MADTVNPLDKPGPHPAKGNDAASECLYNDVLRPCPTSNKKPEPSVDPKSKPQDALALAASAEAGAEAGYVPTPETLNNPSYTRRVFEIDAVGAAGVAAALGVVGAAALVEGAAAAKVAEAAAIAARVDRIIRGVKTAEELVEKVQGDAGPPEANLPAGNSIRPPEAPKPQLQTHASDLPVKPEQSGTKVINYPARIRIGKEYADYLQAHLGAGADSRSPGIGVTEPTDSDLATRGTRPRFSVVSGGRAGTDTEPVPPIESPQGPEFVNGERILEFTDDQGIPTVVHEFQQPCYWDTDFGRFLTNRVTVRTEGVVGTFREVEGPDGAVYWELTSPEKIDGMNVDRYLELPSGLKAYSGKDGLFRPSAERQTLIRKPGSPDSFIRGQLPRDLDLISGEWPAPENPAVE